MPQYQDLSDLREELTVDDPDRRANAYGAVMALEDDVQISDVLGPQPDEDVVDSLVAADVIPPQRGAGRDGRPAAERDEEIVDLLRDILEELREDDVVAQDGGSA